MKTYKYCFILITILGFFLYAGCKTKPKVAEKPQEKAPKFDIANAKKLADPRFKILQQKILNNPTDADAYAQLGFLYGIDGDITNELFYYTKALDIRPDFKEVHYNMACIYSLKGKNQKSIFSLEKAINNGFNTLDVIESDKDLNNIRQDENYKKLIQKYFPK